MRIGIKALVIAALSMGSLLIVVTQADSYDQVSKIGLEEVASTQDHSGTEQYWVESTVESQDYSSADESVEHMDEAQRQARHDKMDQVREHMVTMPEGRSKLRMQRGLNENTHQKREAHKRASRLDQKRTHHTVIEAMPE